MNTDSLLDGLRSELAKVLHLNGCQQRTAGYNDHIDKKDIDIDDMERLEALTLDEVMTEVSLYCHKQVIEELEKIIGNAHTDKGINWWIDLEDVHKRIVELRKTL